MDKRRGYGLKLVEELIVRVYCNFGSQFIRCSFVREETTGRCISTIQTQPSKVALSIDETAFINALTCILLPRSFELHILKLDTWYYAVYGREKPKRTSQHRNAEETLTEFDAMLDRSLSQYLLIL